ncbi:hypothetical protein PGT21_011082 [Puccinia graminis f. sp. tritici]|uniref:Uncharacterized protein n=1 Tax=Puccinia graminis f. sp. tritici TaxID=56615 RepID=A0A5B0QHY8_PUCGR|nr:hypothetical protein PGT21_011082 [Puccinia graminis f. sp. tritici]
MALSIQAQGRWSCWQSDGEGRHARLHALCGASKDPLDKRSYLLGSDLSPGARVSRRHPARGRTKYQGQHTRRTPLVELLRLCSWPDWIATEAGRRCGSQ